MGRILGVRDKTTEAKRKCHGLGEHGMSSYNKHLRVNGPNYPDSPLEKSFGRCTKALCAECDVFAVEGLNQKRKIELLEVKFWKWKKQCLLSRGGRARVPKGPFQLAAPRASASGRTAASQVEC